MLFNDLEIHPDLKKATLDAGFTELTEIQEKCFEPGCSGRDIAGVSQTGTGKTVAFLLPILQKLIQAPTQGTMALIVSPTRELCLQIAEEAEKLCKYTQVKSVAIYGGEDYRRQEKRLSQDPAIVVATPGRLIDFMKQKKITAEKVEFLVLDEADRMLDMGFIRDISYIMKHVPKKSQVFLFSATLSYDILRIASDFMKEPIEVRIESDSVAVDKIEQSLYHLGRDEKSFYMVNQILALENPRIIIFTNFKHAIDRINRQLHRFGISAIGISSLMDQKKRMRLLKDFKSGKYNILVATDVASRGLDVDGITHVINYDLPQDAESYVHRIGRTARAGKSGASYSYCSEDDYENLPRIQRYMDMDIPVGEINSEWLNKPQGRFTPYRDPDSPAPRKEHNNKPEHKKQTSKNKHQGSQKSKSEPSQNKHSNKKGRPLTIREKDRARALGQLSEAEDKESHVFYRSDNKKSNTKNPNTHDENPKSRKSKPHRPKKNRNNNQEHDSRDSRPSKHASRKNAKRHTIKTVRSSKKKGLMEKMKSFFKGTPKN